MSVYTCVILVVGVVGAFGMTVVVVGAMSWDTLLVTAPTAVVVLAAAGRVVVAAAAVVAACRTYAVTTATKWVTSPATVRLRRRRPEQWPSMP